MPPRVLGDLVVAVEGDAQARRDELPVDHVADLARQGQEAVELDADAVLDDVLEAQLGNVELIPDLLELLERFVIEGLVLGLLHGLEDLLAQLLVPFLEVRKTLLPCQAGVVGAQASIPVHATLGGEVLEGSVILLIIHGSYVSPGEYILQHF